jgi:hypothetical protein
LAASRPRDPAATGRIELRSRLEVAADKYAAPDHFPSAEKLHKRGRIAHQAIPQSAAKVRAVQTPRALPHRKPYLCLMPDYSVGPRRAIEQRK